MRVKGKRDVSFGTRVWGQGALRCSCVTPTESGRARACSKIKNVMTRDKVFNENLKRGIDWMLELKYMHT